MLKEKSQYVCITCCPELKEEGKVSCHCKSIGESIIEKIERGWDYCPCGNEEKFVEFSKGEQQSKLADFCLDIACMLHEGQKDKGGEDYIKHPIYVASLLDQEYDKCTAYLHDTIEDCNIDEEYLLKLKVPTEVVTAVRVLSKVRGEKYMDYLERVKENPIARRVKIADLTHNSDISRIPNPTERDFKRLEKYKKAMEFLKEV